MSSQGHFVCLVCSFRYNGLATLALAGPSGPRAGPSGPLRALQARRGRACICTRGGGDVPIAEGFALRKGGEIPPPKATGMALDTLMCGRGALCTCQEDFWLVADSAILVPECCWQMN